MYRRHFLQFMLCNLKYIVMSDLQLYLAHPQNSDTCLSWVLSTSLNQCIKKINLRRASLLRSTLKYTCYNQYLPYYFKFKSFLMHKFLLHPPVLHLSPTGLDFWSPSTILHHPLPFSATFLHLPIAVILRVFSTHSVYFILFWFSQISIISIQ